MAVTVAGVVVEIEFTSMPLLVRDKVIVAEGAARVVVVMLPGVVPPVPAVVVAVGLPLPHPASRARVAAMIHDEKLKTL